MRSNSISCLLVLSLCLVVQAVRAQSDSLQRNNDTFILAKRAGLLGKIGKGLMIRAITPDTIIKIDQTYAKFMGYRIREICIQELGFGASIHDSNSTIQNLIIKASDRLHVKTKEQIIRNNLFFKVGDLVFPLLIADNERFLREQFYLQDSRIELVGDTASKTVDIYIITKDILALGGKFKLHDTHRVETTVSDENNFGRGNRLAVKLLYDLERTPRPGIGASYDFRNIKGSFVDVSFGWQNAKASIADGLNQEKEIFCSIIKPLVSPYFPLTYAISAAYHQTNNRYLSDSSYLKYGRYEYLLVDAWAAYNLGANRFTKKNNAEKRLRKFVSARFVQQQFYVVPKVFEGEYNFLYTDLRAMLGAFTIAKQEFYKARYVYGFGRNEDIPEGFSVALLAGYTNKSARGRGYYALDLERNYFTKSRSYFNYNIKLGAFLHEKGFEDLSWLFSLDYFSKLKKIDKNWTRRIFLNGSFTRLNNIVLLDPLYLSSSFGLPEFSNPSTVSRIRATVRGELVLFNRWSFYGFKFAPIASASFSLLTPYLKDFLQSDGYSSFSVGLRSRNENLVFGTMELRAYCFPRKNGDMSTFKIDFKTNLRFKYNSQLLKRPEFIVVN